MANITKIFIGIDFSKEKFNACLRKEGKILAEEEFLNTKTGFLALMKWAKSISKSGRKTNAETMLFCGEHTGTYSIPLSEYLHAKGFKVWLENALIIKYSSGFSRNKTDVADARMIAQYAERFYSVGQTRLFKPQSKELKQLSSLYHLREAMVGERVRNQNALSSGVYDDSLVAKRSVERRVKSGIEEEKRMLKEMINIVSTAKELKDNYKILTSFKGVGPLTSIMMIITTGNFTEFETHRQFACFSGVAPFVKQSGSSINTNAHVSGFAHKGIKAALTQAAKSAIRTNPDIREYGARLAAKGKPHGVILNNVKNKIIAILFTMIEKRTLWQEDYRQTHASGNQSRKPLGGQEQKRAALAALHADASVQTSPSAFGGAQIYEKPIKNSKMSKKSSQKICPIT